MDRRPRKVALYRETERTLKRSCRAVGDTGGHTRNAVAQLRRLDRSLAYLAVLMKSRSEGDAYWPIFDRLEDERQSLASRQARLEAAAARLSTPIRQRPTLDHRG